MTMSSIISNIRLSAKCLSSLYTVQNRIINSTNGISHGCKIASVTFQSSRSQTTDRRYIPRRAAMYIPGNDEKKLKKIPALNVECAIMDCEDGVALNRKVSCW